MSNIYVVLQETGEYEDYRKEMVIAFDTEEAAQNEVMNLARKSKIESIVKDRVFSDLSRRFEQHPQPKPPMRPVYDHAKAKSSDEKAYAKEHLKAITKWQEQTTVFENTAMKEWQSAHSAHMLEREEFHKKNVEAMMESEINESVVFVYEKYSVEVLEFVQLQLD